IKFIENNGYPAERHQVLTEDGYYLTMHRIPGKIGSTPVFLQHGIGGSSFDWVLSGRTKALAFILSDHGYDVWLGNARGNLYSQRHAKYSTSEYKYWNFSWHEMGVYDLPAALTYVNSKTEKQIIYIGHSMGTTMFFVMAMEKPNVAKKVKAMFALAPVAYMSNLKSPLRMPAGFTKELEKFLKSIELGNLFSRTPAFDSFIKYFCCSSPIHQKGCINIIFSLFGSNPAQLNKDLLPLIVTHAPVGVSFKSIFHYAQGINSKKFARYDYGVEGNWKLYNSSEPPEYNVSKIQTPIGIFWSENDLITDRDDILRFYNQLPHKILDYKVKDPKFNHVDFAWANDVVDLVYSKLLNEMKKYL
ncbi:hypothetical protein QAD02_011516, partial [Eretmocerus hayati]